MDQGVNKNYFWLDITDDFLSSVKQLNLGELLKLDNFTLLEAMSAIELMDPKMDSGMKLERTSRKNLTFEQSVRLGIVKTNQLELTELIGIIDDTYSCLAVWLEGNPLAQTVMTNLYLHEPERIEDRCLRVFSQAILKIVDFMDRLIHIVANIEEEDFQLNYGKFNLANQINESKLANSIEDLCQHYEKLLAEQNSSSKKQQQQQSHEQQPNQSDCIKNEFDKSQLIAIVNRLRFTFYFYNCFWNIYRHILKDHWDLGPQTDAQFLKISKLVHNTVLNCDQHLEKCLKYLDKWLETIDLGIKPKPIEVKELDEGDFSTIDDYPTIMGFNPLVNLKLLPPAYPKCPSIITRPDTIDYLKNLISRLRHCFLISNSFNQKSFINTQESIEHLSKYFRPSSCVISRSLIQSLYLPNRSDRLFKEELLQSMNDYCEPLVQIMKKDGTSSNALNEFLDECSRSFSQSISIFGHNAARQHEKFPELILSFKNLQYSALLINNAFDNSIIYSWTTFHSARLCIRYVLASLELELFSPHEYPYVFWYLYDILYRNEKDQLELAKQSIYDSQFIVDDNQRKAKGKKVRKKNQFNTSTHDKCLVSIEGFRLLTGGTFLLTHGLRLQGKIKTPVMEYTTEEICFEHRFGSLTGASVYQSYRQTLNRLDRLDNIYREALECFSEAKELFQGLTQHDNCLKVCKTNMIVARILSSNPNSFTDREVEFSFDTHPSFPTVKV